MGGSRHIALPVGWVNRVRCPSLGVEVTCWRWRGFCPRLGLVEGENRDSSEREQRWGSSQPDCTFTWCPHSK